jgi:N-acetylglucosaminyldiphosphoundecaprenol N-acetyl-beta-D-mannosaminyltransferase
MTKKTKKTSISDTKKIDDNVQILGVVITGTQRESVLSKIKLQRKNLLHIATVNPEFVMEARTNPRFAYALSKCELTVADGWGVVWALQLTQGIELDRISGVDVVTMILEHASKEGRKVFLLGARSGVAELAAKRIAKVYPGAQVAWYEGARSVAVEGKDEASMTIAKINTFEPDYLLVAYGSPWQDIWIEENRQYLRVGVAVGVGGTLDELARVVPVCPTWLDRIGLKWLFRLVVEPKRWRRQLKLVQFAWLVLYHKLID